MYRNIIERIQLRCQLPEKSYMIDMARKPKKPNKPVAGRRPGRPPMASEKKKKANSVHVSLRADLYERLVGFCQNNPYEPSMTKTMEIALERFLDAESPKPPQEKSP